MNHDELLSMKIKYIEKIVGPITERERSLLWLFHYWGLRYIDKLPPEVERSNKE